jgi:hypothetical protein
MPVVKLQVDYFNGFLPSIEGVEIQMQKKLHSYPQKIYALFPVTEWNHPPGVRCYVHALDDKGSLLGCQHGGLTPGSMQLLLSDREQYESLIQHIPDLKEKVDAILAQMEGHWW